MAEVHPEYQSAFKLMDLTANFNEQGSMTQSCGRQRPEWNFGWKVQLWLPILLPLAQSANHTTGCFEYGLPWQPPSCTECNMEIALCTVGRSPRQPLIISWFHPALLIFDDFDNAYIRLHKSIRNKRAFECSSQFDLSLPLLHTWWWYPSRDPRGPLTAHWISPAAAKVDWQFRKSCFDGQFHCCVCARIRRDWKHDFR